MSEQDLQWYKTGYEAWRNAVWTVRAEPSEKDIARTLELLSMPRDRRPGSQTDAQVLEAFVRQTCYRVIDKQGELVKPHRQGFK